MTTDLISTTDGISQAIVAITIVGVFAVLTLEKVHRVLVVLAALALLWGVTYLTPFRVITLEGAARAIDVNVLFLLASMMALVGVLKSTGVFAWAVARLLRRTEGKPILVVRIVSWATGILSAFMDNVTTVIFITPMAIGMSRRFRVRAAVFLLPMIMASNIGGTATLIGDPPNIMIGSGAGLPFTAFLWNLTMPVVLMMFALEWFSLRYYADDLAARPDEAEPVMQAIPPITNPLLLKVTLAITAFVFLGFLTHGITHMPAAVPATIGAAAALLAQDLIYLRRHDPTTSERAHGLLDVIEREIEWPTLLFFTFLFIVVGAAVQTGLIARIAGWLGTGIHAGAATMGLGTNGTLLFASLVLLWVSGVLSAFIDNIPYVAVAIPIVARLTTGLEGNTEVLWWALALGACLGGNGTLVGASANVTTVGIAERDGTKISFTEFTAFGARVATITLLISSAYLSAFIYFGSRPTFWGTSALVAILLLIRFGRARSAPATIERPAAA